MIKPIYLLKLRWLYTQMSNISPDQFDVVLRLIDKGVDMEDDDIALLDKVYAELRENGRDVSSFVEG